jgi:hypothetical protein
VHMCVFCLLIAVMCAGLSVNVCCAFSHCVLCIQSLYAVHSVTVLCIQSLCALRSVNVCFAFSQLLETTMTTTAARRKRSGGRCVRKCVKVVFV